MRFSYSLGNTEEFLERRGREGYAKSAEKIKGKYKKYKKDKNLEFIKNTNP
jgi:hypothetical protein